jgi:RHS repeat-associated protein
VTASVENYKIQNTNYKQITNKVAPFGQVLNAFGEKGTHELHELTRIKGSHDLHRGSYPLQSMTALNKSFCGGSRGAVFSKSAPLAAGGKAIESSYDWLVPDTPSDNCLVRIKGSTDSIIPDTSDAVFSIASPQNPILTVNFPNGGETLLIGNTYEINWSNYGTVAEEVKIDFSVDSGVNWTEITASTENDGAFDWLVPDTASGTCLVKVSELDDDPVDVSDAVFSISAPAGDYIMVISPNGGEAINGGDSFNITWDSSGDIQNVNIEYSIDEGDSWAAVVTSTANDGSYTWPVPVTPSDLCLVRISNSDRDNEPTDVSDAVFSIVTIGPTITVISPNGGEVLVSGTSHDITWIGTPDITYVDIDFSFDNGGNWVNIVSASENNGSYTWTVPDSESDHCLIRISDSDFDTGAADTSDNEFSIVKDEPPACGGSWVMSNYIGNDVFNAVTFGGGKFVAVGNNGVIKTSADGINWKSRTSNTTADLYGVDLGYYDINGNIPIAVCGENGTILSSNDFINWTPQSTGTNKTLYSINYKEGLFVAVGVDGTILKSYDDEFWNIIPANISQTLYGSTFGYRFAAVGADGAVYTSPYGDDWYQRSSVTSKNLRGITYGDNHFLAVGDSGVILTSSGVTNWIGRTSSINVDLKAAAYGNGVYVVVGNNGKILTSEDLVKWTSRSSGVRNNLSGIAFGNSRFVAVGEGVIIYSNCEQVTVAKSFNKSMDFPFDVSDRNPEIRYNEDMYDDTAGYDDVYPGHGGNAGTANNFYSSTSSTLNNSTPGKSRTAQLYNTYYIYTFDGKLLAEYDHNGNCVRDYIYAGNRLIAEYKPQTGEYFYYMTDQINSTRIITNGSGNVVFSEAYGPYGDIQKTWTNTYDPKLKFSGKEREGYSDLDYFGARYYNNKTYRFNSVDPVINKAGALLKPQMWNLYAYCDNNPITFFDPDGREPNKSQVTNPTKLITYINNTKGGTARSKLAFLGKYGTLGGASPSKKRYIYTEKAGWIDLVHFFHVAAELDKLSGIERIGAWMFGGFALWQKTKEIENNQAAKGLIGTAWSYEDAPSNYYGWIFWKFYYDPNGNLGDQMQRFLEDYGGTNPQNAPNWNQMWIKENPKKRQFPQNKSFNPKFTK